MSKYKVINKLKDGTQVIKKGNGEKVFRKRVRIKGLVDTSVTASSLSEVRRLHDEEKAKYLTKKKVQRKSIPTLGHLADRVIKESYTKAEIKCQSLPEWEHKRVMEWPTRKEKLIHFLLEKLGRHTLVTHLDEEVIHNLKLDIAKLRNEGTTRTYGEPLSTTSKNRYLRFLKEMLIRADLSEWKPPKIPLFAKTENDGVRDVQIEAKNLRDLFQELPEFPKHPHHLIVSIMLISGARSSDTLSLKWSQVKGRIMHVKNRKAGKNGKLVELDPWLLEMVNAWRAECEDKNRITEYMFPSSNSECPYIKNVHGVISRAAERIGLSRCGPHDFRHLSTETFAEATGNLEGARRHGQWSRTDEALRYTRRFQAKDEDNRKHHSLIAGHLGKASSGITRTLKLTESVINEINHRFGSEVTDYLQTLSNANIIDFPPHELKNGKTVGKAV